ncbi:hypothetical protein HK100_006967 [Physocladia obscura]|uniref:Uncharacterized protein n=1 Tax=Physocladia obscura TaxID=109957 RepID=A0AAD5SRJ8_9FUNG|nr:hypothetical protein HK100_006967 [Physocladia obscura]
MLVDIQQQQQLVVTHATVLVVGASGSGKTALVRALVAPTMRPSTMLSTTALSSSSASILASASSSAFMSALSLSLSPPSVARSQTPQQPTLTSSASSSSATITAAAFASASLAAATPRGIPTELPTVGISATVVRLDRTLITVVEVGGGVAAQTLLAAAAREADAVLAVYDVGSAASFDALPALVERIEAARGCVAPLLVVGSMVDTLSTRARQVPSTVGRAFASRLSATTTTTTTLAKPLGPPVRSQTVSSSSSQTDSKNNFREISARAPRAVLECFTSLLALVNDYALIHAAEYNTPQTDNNSHLYGSNNNNNNGKKVSTSSFGALDLVKQWRVRRIDSNATLINSGSASENLEQQQQQQQQQPQYASSIRRASQNDNSFTENIRTDTTPTPATAAAAAAPMQIQTQIGQSNSSAAYRNSKSEAALHGDDERFFVSQLLQKLSSNSTKQPPRNGSLRQKRDYVYSLSNNNNNSVTDANNLIPSTLVYSTLYNPAVALQLHSNNTSGNKSNNNSNHQQQQNLQKQHRYHVNLPSPSNAIANADTDGSFALSSPTAVGGSSSNISNASVAALGGQRSGIPRRPLIATTTSLNAANSANGPAGGAGTAVGGGMILSASSASLSSGATSYASFGATPSSSLSSASMSLGRSTNANHANAGPASTRRTVHSPNMNATNMAFVGRGSGSGSRSGTTSVARMEGFLAAAAMTGSASEPQQRSGSGGYGRSVSVPRNVIRPATPTIMKMESMLDEIDCLTSQYNDSAFMGGDNNDDDDDEEDWISGNEFAADVLEMSRTLSRSGGGVLLGNNGGDKENQDAAMNAEAARVAILKDVLPNLDEKIVFDLARKYAGGDDEVEVAGGGDDANQNGGVNANAGLKENIG